MLLVLCSPNRNSKYQFDFPALFDKSVTISDYIRTKETPLCSLAHLTATFL